ncbi:MAG TPA: hypothetical protein VF173_38330 [Thermoanaerobaculia bacterium]|nr:hypothetical protein [Thermoanaerobaculia bacterium]
MSQQIRRVLIASGLTATLFLALPAPSRAAGIRDTGLVPGLTARAWAWLESLLAGVPAPPAPAPRPGRIWEKQGSAIDPNGRARAVIHRVPADEAAAEQGSAIDPNGNS